MHQLISISSFLLLFIAGSCSGSPQGKISNSEKSETASPSDGADGDQIGQYVTAIFEDSKGSLWFGTLDKGLARYDGSKFRYFTTADGLVANSVINVLEDNDGIIWIGTQEGLSKFDGKTFTNFTEKDGLCHLRLSNLLLDSKGRFWVGTWDGVCTFDGKTFTKFPIPYPEINTRLNKDTQGWITEIMEDKQGNIWFGRDGYGASKYDGKSFVHYTTKDGLPSNNVQNVTEDQSGNIWFGTRVAEKDDPDPEKRFGPGGLTKYDGKVFTQFPNVKGLSSNDVYSIRCDKQGTLWVSTIGEGVYKYDGQAFTNFRVSEAADKPSKAVQSILKDSNGNMWFGCSGGLFRLNENGVVNVTTDGPWD